MLIYVLSLIPQLKSLTAYTSAQDGYSLIVYGGSAPAAVNGVIPSLRPNVDSEITLSDVQVLDTRTYTWSAPTTHGVAQNARYAHTAVQVGGLMIVMGGELQTRSSIGQNYSANLVNDTQVLDTTQWTWLSTYTPPTNWTSHFATSVISPTSVVSSTPVGSYTPVQSSSGDSGGGGDGNGIGIGAIAGIVAGAVVVTLAAVFLFIRYNRSSRAGTAPGSQNFPQNQGPPQYGSPAQPYGSSPQPGQPYGTHPGQPYSTQPGQPYDMQFVQPPMHGGQGPSFLPPHQSAYGHPQTRYSYATDGQGYNLHDSAAYAAPLAPGSSDKMDLSENQYPQTVPPPWWPSKIDQDQAKVDVVAIDVSKPDDAGEESDIHRY
ncbi:hypothetical protein BC937DRAFT_93905 [Endogone sp. FLAS-F59071]|nr:hypothetical protein BC937DRAFT_93905 [Endogone sp. FLAS-F59071]|eukprot:RUS14387.1 hypothetical protein BC937DRAFT_93905 [Endogone sp. FLAS-F59071]